MYRLAAAALAGIALAASPAFAQQNDALSADTRCAMVGMMLTNAEGATPQQQQVGAMMTVYYVGRMHGRSPGIDLNAAFNAQAQSMTGQSAQADGQRCSAEFSTVGALLAGPGQSPPPSN